MIGKFSGIIVSQVQGKAKQWSDLHKDSQQWRQVSSVIILTKHAELM